jgi:hypothetical protein
MRTNNMNRNIFIIPYPRTLGPRICRIQGRRAVPKIHGALVVPQTVPYACIRPNWIKGLRVIKLMDRSPPFIRAIAVDHTHLFINHTRT